MIPDSAYSSDRRTVGPSDRLGFTLIEVLTALAVIGVVALLSHRLLGVVVDGVKQLDQARIEQDRKENGRRWLRSAFLSLEAGDSAGGFEGRSQRVSFTSWIEQASGWYEQRRVSLEQRNDRVVALISDRPALILADSAVDLRFDYLLEPGANTKWAGQWVSPLSAPLAIRIRLLRRSGSVEIGDTLLFLVKERG